MKYTVISEHLSDIGVYLLYWYDEKEKYIIECSIVQSVGRVWLDSSWSININGFLPYFDPIRPQRENLICCNDAAVIWKAHNITIVIVYHQLGEYLWVMIDEINQPEYRVKRM